MARNRRPTVILVMAILNMVMGGLTLLCGLCVGSEVAMASAMGSAPLGPGGGQVGDLKAYLDKEAPGWAIVQVGDAVMQLLLAVILVIAGIGLLKMQRWARWLSLFYSAVSLLLAVGFSVYIFAILQPARLQFQEQQMNLSAQPASTQAGFQFGKTAGILFNVVMYAVIPIAYAIALAIVMVLPNVGAAFAANNRRRYRRQDEEDDYGESDERDRDEDDWDDDSPRRRRREPDY